MPTPPSSSPQQMPPLPKGPSLESVRGPVEIPLYEPWQIALFITLGILALGCFIWLVIVISLRKKRKRKVPCAYASAQTQLQIADQADDDEHFAQRCSGALRHYFEEGLGIAAKGRTSEEFLRRLKGDTRFDGSFHAKLEQFYAQCDAIKFARSKSDPAQRNAILKTAEELIEQASQSKEPAEL